jgi:hypothetical protein
MVNTLNGFRTDGHLSAAGVALYVDALKLRRLDRLPAGLRMHVEECFQCKTEVTGLFSLVAESDYSREGPHPTLDAPESAHTPATPVILRAAASIAVVVGLGALGYWWFSHASDARVEGTAPLARHPAITDTLQIRETRKEGIVARQQPLAAAFAESAEMEDLMKSAVRSEEAVVRSPANGAYLKPGVRFEWTTVAKPPFDLLIVNNLDRTVRSLQLQENAYVMKDPLPSGLYYWKLIGEGELLHVGKFKVR